MVKINEIINISKEIKTYVEKNKKLPTKIGKYSLPQATYLMSRFIAKPSNEILKTYGGGAKSPTGAKLNRTVTKKTYTDMARRVYQYIEKNGYSPNNVWDDEKNRVSIILWTYVTAKIIVYYNNHQKTFPLTVLINSNDFVKGNISSDEVYNYFVQQFGKIEYIDDALEKIQNKGYGYYYDDRYSNKESIDRIKKGQGINCTDSCHVFYHIAKALGYKVQVIHVKCKGGDGHVRLKLTKNGVTFNRDPACVLEKNGKPITNIWCGDGTLLATDPSWFIANVNR